MSELLKLINTLKKDNTNPLVNKDVIIKAFEEAQKELDGKDNRIEVDEGFDELQDDTINKLVSGDLLIHNDDTGYVVYKDDAEMQIFNIYGNSITMFMYQGIEGEWDLIAQAQYLAVPEEGDFDVSGTDFKVKSLTSDGGPIIEGMSGYSFSVSADAGWNKVIGYAGAVKNGNKLTLVIAGTLEKTDNDGTSYPTLGNFYLPVEVANKIIPISQSFVDFRMLDLFVSLGDSTTARAYTEKSTSTNNRLKMVAYLAPTLNKVYNFRYELTFLLSDSLAS